MSNRKISTCKTVCLNKEKICKLKEKLPETQELAASACLYKAMGHPSRLAILYVLAIEECCVCDLANILDQPVSTVSQNLRVLKTAGLLLSRQEGKLVFYSLTNSGGLIRRNDGTLVLAGAGVTES